jgi:alkylmercury lyase
VTSSRDQRGCCEPDGVLGDGLSAVGLELARAGFSAVWHGEARRPSELVDGDPHLVAETVAELVRRGRCQVDNEGRLVGVHGVTLLPTRHRIIHGGGERHTWCAFDAVGIPAALDIDARAVTTCLTCGDDITIDITRGAADDADVRLWLPPLGGEHLMESFCAAADLYCSLQHLEHQHGDAAGEVLDLGAVLELGRETWADVAPDNGA